MKQLVSLIVFVFLLIPGSKAGVYIIEGVYQGKDIYVQNPFATEGVGFCIFEVLVNGKVTSDEINSSAFAVDLSMFEFELGDEVIITIRSKTDCTPKIINPDAISPTSSCVVANVKLKSSSELSWSTTGENGKLPFIIEHFKWNKWVEIGSVLGEGKVDKMDYSVKVNLPAGENKLRIKQKDYNGEKITEEVILLVDKPVVTLDSEKVSDAIDFSGKTHFELYDSYGEIVKSGYNSICKVKDLEKGIYYLNYELTFGTEIKKK